MLLAIQGNGALKQEAAQVKAQATEVLFRLGLAALALSDYIRTVLCRELQDHEPEPGKPGLVLQVMSGCCPYREYKVLCL